MSPTHSAVMQEVCSTLEQALQTCAGLEQEKSALAKDKAELTRRVGDLQAKLAAQEKVVLEKVATHRGGLDEALIAETLGQLSDMAMIAPGSVAKIASQLRSDPNGALRLAQRVATLSVPSHNEGRAVEKSAGHSASTSDPDGWGKVLSQGAA